MRIFWIIAITVSCVSGFLHDVICSVLRQSRDERELNLLLGDRQKMCERASKLMRDALNK